MSLTVETAKIYANEPAVLCRSTESGVIIEPSILENPTIFDELVASGLLNLDGCLKIGQVIGAKLTKTCDSLSPLTTDNVEGFGSFEKLTAEEAIHLRKQVNEPAVLCCRAEKGVTIEPSILENPIIFDELVASGLLNLDGCLKIGQVVGAKLTKTCDSLSPLTTDNVEGFKTDEELVADEALYIQKRKHLLKKFL